MRARWVALVVVFGCGPSYVPNERLPRGPRHRLKPPEELVVQQQPPQRKPKPPKELAEKLDDAWEELDVDGDNWSAQLQTIPPYLQSSMAIRFLQQGNFACPAKPLLPGQCEKDRTVQQPSSDSSIDDPCLRRRIALWAIDRIDPDPAIVEVAYDALVELVRLPPPERELGPKALARIPDGYQMANALWEAKAAGNVDLTTKTSLASLQADDLRIAATEFHLDAAVLALDAEHDEDVFREAINDRYLLPTTRLRTIDALVEVADRRPERRDGIRDALSSVTASSDCIIAAAATAAIAKVDANGIPTPSGPFTTEADVIRAACSALGVDAHGKPWKQVIARHGLKVVSQRFDPLRADALWTQYPFAYDADMNGAPDVPEADPDGDGDVATTRDVRTAAWSKRFTLPFADELRLALPHCDGADCHVPDSSVWFHLDIAKERGTRLRLEGIERHEHVGSDC